MPHPQRQVQSSAKPDGCRTASLFTMLVKAAVERPRRRRRALGDHRRAPADAGCSSTALAERLGSPAHRDRLRRRYSFLYRRRPVRRLHLVGLHARRADEVRAFTDLSRNDLFTSTATLLDRYVIRTHQGAPLSRRRYLRNALHLVGRRSASERMGWVRCFY